MKSLPVVPAILLIACAAVALIAAALSLGQSGRVDIQPSTRESRSLRNVAPRAEVATPPALPRSEASSARWLLRVLEHDEPVSGTAVWRCAETVERVQKQPLHPGLPNTAAARVTAGSWTLEPTPGQWTRVKISTEDRTRTFVLEPIADDTSRTLDLADPTTTLRVLVLGPDARTPAAGVEVLCTRTPLADPQGPGAAFAAGRGTQGARPAFWARGGRTALDPAAPDASAREDRAAARTDSRGRVTFQIPAAGSFLVEIAEGEPTAASPGPDERMRRHPPHIARVVVPEGPDRHAVLTLVAPWPEREVTLQIHANVPPQPPLGTKLVARRIAGGTSLERPVAGSIESGYREQKLTLPAGTWVFETLPSHRFSIDVSGPLVVDEDPVVHSMRIAARTGTTAVRLTGIGLAHLPARVQVRSAGAIHHHRPRLGVYGPFQWGHRAVDAPSITEPVRLVAMSRRRVSWISERPLSIEGAELDVPMLPATLLSVRWPDWEPGVDDAAVLAVEVGDDVFLRTFWTQYSGGVRPVRLAELVVPLGPAVLTVSRLDGEVVWRQELELVGGGTSATVGGTS